MIKVKIISNMASLIERDINEALVLLQTSKYHSNEIKDVKLCDSHGTIAMIIYDHKEY